jgi:hypothetical protein
MSSYAREIKSIDGELKRLNARLKQLRAQKRAAQDHLYTYMVSHKVDNLNGITLKQCAPPKPRAKQKPKAQRKADAVGALSEIGVPDPDGLYDTLESLRRTNPNTHTSDEDDELEKVSKPRKGKKESYDDSLGF